MPGMGQATPPATGGPEPRPAQKKPHQKLGRKLPQGKSGNTLTIVSLIDLTRVQMTKFIKILLKITDIKLLNISKVF